MKISIVLSSDDSYSEHLAATLCSLFVNKMPSTEVEIFILDGGISPANKEYLAELEEKYNFSINYLTPKTDYFRNFPEIDHLKIPTYFRLLAPQLIDRDRLLYLDCDLIVLKDLSPLYSENLAGRAFGAVPDVMESYMLTVRPGLKRYFNAGVLLIDRKAWLENDLTGKTSELITSQPEKIKLADQDALNYCCQEYWQELDQKYNCQLNPHIRKIVGKIFILHYVSGIKPWHFSYCGIKREIYNKYLRQTHWKKTVYPDKNFGNFLKRSLKTILYSSGILKPGMEIRHLFKFF